MLFKSLFFSVFSLQQLIASKILPNLFVAPTPYSTHVGIVPNFSYSIWTISTPHLAYLIRPVVYWQSAQNYLVGLLRRFPIYGVSFWIEILNGAFPHMIFAWKLVLFFLVVVSLEGIGVILSMGVDKGV